MLTWRDGIWFLAGVVAGLAGLIVWAHWEGWRRDRIWAEYRGRGS